VKRWVLLGLILCWYGIGYGQNFQFHYDLGKDRKYVTTTFEMFKPDEYGSTFWFIDMDYNRTRPNGLPGMSLSYLELARYVTIPRLQKLSATAQYNDGLVGPFPLGPVWLFGVSYPIDLGFVTLNTDLLYRNAYNSDGPDAQLTLVWQKSLLADNRLTLMGFMDLWTADKAAGGKQFVLLSEPQVWYRVTDHLNLGGEVEISNNFLPDEKFGVKPTLGFKWIF